MADAMSHDVEQVNTQRPATAPGTNSVASLLVTLRASLKAHGAKGMCGLARKFKIVDDSGDGQIQFDEFTKCMAEHSMGWTSNELRSVFASFDADGSGAIGYDEFLLGVRGPMNERRVGLVLRAFAILDEDKSGVIEVSDLHGKYNGKKHPDVIAGKRTEDEVLREFLDTFDSGKKDGRVEPDEFITYYANVSSSIDDDDYFELMIRNAWHISGGEGQCANTSCRRVLVTHADGKQTVEEIKDDLGIGPEDKDAMLAHLKAQGLSVSSIDISGSCDEDSPPAGGASLADAAAVRDGRVRVSPGGNSSLVLG